MGHIHQNDLSEWEDTYRNFQVAGSDVAFAVIILEIFALVALTF